MKLYINTTDAKKLIIGLDDERFTTDTVQRHSQKLLPFIEEKLKQNGKTIDDISEIKVETGPGSFTGLRVGLSVANAIGWSKDILVNGKNIKDDGPVVPNY